MSTAKKFPYIVFIRVLYFLHVEVHNALCSVEFLVTRLSKKSASNTIVTIDKLFNIALDEQNL